jgi:hypothetical protein
MENSFFLNSSRHTPQDFSAAGTMKISETTERQKKTLFNMRQAQLLL